MRLLSITALCVLLSAASIVAQEPSAENFGRYRAQVIDRLTRSAERIEGLTGRRPPNGTPLNANVSGIFGIPNETRVIDNAAEIAFRDDHRITLTFATNSTDIILTESKKTSDGTLLRVFHTDLTLALRGAASGVDANSLQPFDNESDAQSVFRDVLMTWDRHLPRMLERQLRK
jgi:hypothetical protein